MGPPRVRYARSKSYDVSLVAPSWEKMVGWAKLGADVGQSYKQQQREAARNRRQQHQEQPAAAKSSHRARRISRKPLPAAASSSQQQQPVEASQQLGAATHTTGAAKGAEGRRYAKPKSDRGA